MAVLLPRQSCSIHLGCGREILSMNRINTVKTGKTTGSDQPKVASSGNPENASPPRQKQYLTRLANHELPSEPVPPRRLKLPTQLQLAQIAAAMATGTGNDKTASVRVQKAFQLWSTAGGLLCAQKQVRVVAEGLLHFNISHWRRHVTSLLVGLDDSCFTEQVATDQKGAKEQAKLSSDGNVLQAAGRAVEAYWRRRGLTNEDVLKAIFFGKNDQNIYTQTQMLSDLLAYAKDALEIANTAQLSDVEVRERHQNPDLFGEQKSELDVWMSSIQEAWKPLENVSRSACWNLVTLTRETVTDVPAFASDNSLAVYPCVARWLATMRQRQVSVNKKRFPR